MLGSSLVAVSGAYSILWSKEQQLLGEGCCEMRMRVGLHSLPTGHFNMLKIALLAGVSWHVFAQALGGGR